MFRRANPFIVRSLKAALIAFLNAPAGGGHITNDHLVQSVIGARGSHGKDCPTFDNVRVRYSAPKACTFEKAFNACWHGSRDWREFDLETLQDSHEEFQYLGLPERVEAAIQQEQYVEHYAQELR